MRPHVYAVHVTGSLVPMTRTRIAGNRALPKIVAPPRRRSLPKSRGDSSSSSSRAAALHHGKVRPYSTSTRRCRCPSVFPREGDRRVTLKDRSTTLSRSEKSEQALAGVFVKTSHTRDILLYGDITRTRPPLLGCHGCAYTTNQNGTHPRERAYPRSRLNNPLGRPNKAKNWPSPTHLVLPQLK